MQTARDLLTSQRFSIDSSSEEKNESTDRSSHHYA
jgi:hypothetical protein